MPDLKFFDRFYGELEYEPESNCYNIPQYQRWFARVESNASISPHIKSIERLIPLAWDNELAGFVLPKDDWVIKNTIIGMSGKLILYDSNGIELTPYLYLIPDNISEDEFAEILDRLGQLAIVHESGVLAPVTVLRDAGSLAEEGKGFWTRADAFEYLTKVINDNWENIKKRPAKEIRLSPKVVDLTHSHTSHSVRSIYHASQKPHQRRQQILDRKETFDSAENRFLVHVIRDILLPRAKPLAEYIKSQASKVKRIHMQPAKQHGQAYLNLWRKRRVEIEAESQRLEIIAQKIENTAKRLQDYLNAPFLEEAQKTTLINLRPSAKIAASKEYGPIYNAFQDYLNNKRPGQHKNLVWALEEKTVRRTSNLYEMWVFLEIYSKLVYDFGFEPEGDSPLDLAEVIDGEITLREGSRYKLVFKPKGDNSEKSLCKVTISYVPTLTSPACNSQKGCFSSEICSSLPCFNRWSFLTPDITLSLETSKLTKKIALDVKYRNYGRQKAPAEHLKREFQINTLFEYDLLVTAKMKYLNELDYDASFFLHSDPKLSYTKFGAEPFPAPPMRERKLEMSYYPAHRVGAICITPKHDQNLDKLLRAFLMYHANLEAVCWRCHTLLTEENGGLNRQTARGKGDYYQCPECGQFWVAQVCGNPEHHRLIKLGKESFHKISAQNEWNCTCPACGDSYNENFFAPE